MVRPRSALSRILALSLALAALPAPAFAAWRACTGMTIARPALGADGDRREVFAMAPDNAIGCRHGVSLTVGDATLWRCQVVPAEGQEDLPDGVPPYAFFIDRPGQPRQILPDDLMAGRFRSFEVTTVDLDGDGIAERVLAAWNMQSNGLGVNSWTIRVFDQGWKQLGQFDTVADWGPSSITRAPRGRRGCDLAITAFVESVNRRGVGGISFEARFHRLAGGHVEEASDRPAVQRRYDFAFERQRTAHFRGETEYRGDVATWLANARPSPPRR